MQKGHLPHTVNSVNVGTGWWDALNALHTLNLEHVGALNGRGLAGNHVSFRSLTNDYQMGFL